MWCLLYTTSRRLCRPFAQFVRCHTTRFRLKPVLTKRFRPCPTEAVLRLKPVSTKRFRARPHFLGTSFGIKKFDENLAKVLLVRWSLFSGFEGEKVLLIFLALKGKKRCFYRGLFNSKRIIIRANLLHNTNSTRENGTDLNFDMKWACFRSISVCHPHEG